MAKKDHKWHVPELTIKAKIIVGLAVFVFGGALAVWVVVSTLTNQIKGSDGKVINVDEIRKSLEGKDATDRKQTARSGVRQALADGNDKKADVIYEQALSVETDPIAKVRLAIGQSNELYRAGKYDEALDVAKKAESYSDDKYLIDAWLSQLYFAGKRYDDAAKYYALTASLADSPTNKTGFPKSYYEDKAAEMKKLSAGAS